MKTTITPLNDYVQTIKEIYRLSKKYSSDVADFDNFSFEEFFNFVCDIPYIKDDSNEVVQRAKYTIEANKGDCKKKSIVIGSFCHRHGIPVRFCVMSSQRNKQPHHIYNEVWDDEKGEWITADATYKNNRLGENHKKQTYKEVWA